MIPAEVVPLFRYRDLTAATLEEHREILFEKGSCWWGWWKRPMEDPCTRVWQLLKSRITESGSANVLLFHSGQQANLAVHRAVIDNVWPPELDETGEAKQLLPTADMRELVPAYYRDSPYSRAWIRIKSIAAEPLQFFGKYSLHEAPPLPNYAPSDLLLLRDIVLLDPSELTGMDTTIWLVRPRKSTDKEERILALRTTVSSPVSATPILARGNSILHLTDLHYAVGPVRSQHIWRLENEEGAGFTLATAISGALQSLGTVNDIGVLIVTGDLTFTGAQDEFKAASASLQKLMGVLNLGREHVVIIPGNHDIQWSTQERYADEPQVDTASAEAEKNYRSFYVDFYRHEPHRNLCMGRRYVFSHGATVDICALNSSSLIQGKDFLAGMGRVQEAGFSDVINTLGWKAPPGLVLRMLALHHHLVPTENLEAASGYYKGFGLAIDAPRVQRKAREHGVQLALHGHKHRYFLWHSGVYDLPDEAASATYRGQLAVIGGGTAGSPTTEKGQFFHTIQLASDGLVLTSYRSENQGMFDKRATIRAEYQLTDRGLELGSWRR
jgi:3',5'-cyclic AMP phosphodiesterase CpdA